jgi:Ca2+-transporting ATPase
MILWEQFTNIMLVMLIAVAVVSAVLDLKSGISQRCDRYFYNCYFKRYFRIFTGKSGRKGFNAALKQLSSPKVRVIRNGSTFEVTAKELVPWGISCYWKRGYKLPPMADY